MKLCLVDVSHFFWSAWHSTADQPISEAFERTVAAVHKAANGYDLVAIAVDEPPYLRKELAESYKANRISAPPMAHEQFSRVKARLRKDGFLLWGVKGHEGDDVCATAVRFAVADKRITQIDLWSADKDLAALVSDSLAVRMISTRTGEAYTEASVFAKFGVHPEQMGDYLALVGDSSDGIAGAKGVGPKTAASLLAEWKTLDAILENVGKLKGKLRENVEASIETVRLARKLVALNTAVPIVFAEVFERRTVEPIATEAPFGDEERAAIQEEEQVTDQEVDEIVSKPKSGEPFEPKAPPKSEPEAAPQQTAEIVPIGNGHTQQAIMAAPSKDWRLNMEPNDLRSAYVLAKSMVNSRLYTKFGNPDAIMAIMLRGREMGLGALESLDSFHLVEGRPTPSAHLLISKAKQHDACEYFQFVGGDDTYAEYVCKRRGNPEPTRLRYTIEQAEKAGLLRRAGNWAARPAEMLRKTCGTQLARIEFPDALGSAYSTEELSEAG